MEKIGAYTDRVTDSGEWRPGNPATGQRATPMLSQYFNMLQRELVNVVESTGNVLNKEDDAQLLTAINQLIGGAIGEKLIVRASASTALTDKQMGLVLIDASGQDVTIALPAADAALGVVDVILWRTDGTARTCTIAPAGVDRIMRDTAQYPAGQSSETLQFSGDWLHLRADAGGKWWSVGAAANPAPADTVYLGTDNRRFLTPQALVESIGRILQPEITGSATFSGNENRIQMSGIVTTLKLEIGDVIEISGSASNNKLHTVESIESNDEIIVNYEHSASRCNGLLKLSDEETASVTVTRISNRYSASDTLGRAWVNVTTLKNNNATHLNTTNRPIHVYYDGGESCALALDGANLADTAVGRYGAWLTYEKSYQRTSGSTQMIWEYR